MVSNPDGSLTAALAFVDAINRHSLDDICSLMTEDHLFVDSQGQSFRGREPMRQGWAYYFGMFPDYKITVSESLVSESRAVLLGHASGTYCINGAMSDENHWAIPVALKAKVQAGLIAEWQVFADNSSVLAIVNSNQ